jgi:hypothetical protein
MNFVEGLQNFSSISNTTVGNFKPSRVVDIILDENHVDFNKFVSPIGIIQHSPLSQELLDNKIYARPLFPHFKSYPIKNEIIYIIDGPISSWVESKEIATYYIPQSVAIWNHPHLNPLPNKKDENDDVSIGTNTFVYRDDIRPLRPYEGDVIIEGRFGNSIRLGSSNFKTRGSQAIGINPWSLNSGSNAQPITIIRNGQKIEDDKRAYDYLNEDLANDLSSIYLTSNQRIIFPSPRFEFQASYSNLLQNGDRIDRPSSLSSYDKSQAIMVSDRIVLNSKQDDIFLLSKKSINLSSQGVVNIDSDTASVINSPEIYLGLNADEPLLKGNTTGEFLKQVLDLISELIDDLVVNFTLTSGAPGEKTGPYSGNFELLNPLQKRIDLLKQTVDNNANGMKSNNNFTN